MAADCAKGSPDDFDAATAAEFERMETLLRNKDVLARFDALFEDADSIFETVFGERGE